MCIEDSSTSDLVCIYINMLVEQSLNFVFVVVHNINQHCFFQCRSDTSKSSVVQIDAFAINCPHTVGDKIKFPLRLKKSF